MMMVLLTALTVAGATAVAALGGYAIYRGAKATRSSRPALRGALTGAALFVWTAVTLPIAALLVTGGVIVGLALVPLLLAGLGLSLLTSDRRRVDTDPDTVTIN